MFSLSVLEECRRRKKKKNAKEKKEKKKAEEGKKGKKDRSSEDGDDKEEDEIEKQIRELRERKKQIKREGDKKNNNNNDERTLYFTNRTGKSQLVSQASINIGMQEELERLRKKVKEGETGERKGDGGEDPQSNGGEVGAIAEELGKMHLDGLEERGGEDVMVIEGEGIDIDMGKPDALVTQGGAAKAEAAAMSVSERR